MLTRRDKDDLLREIASLKEEIHLLRSEKRAVSEAAKYAGEVNDLKEQIVNLKIEKARIDEDHDREKREVEHLVGLQRKRQDFEVEAAKRDTELSVREGNLKEEQKRFDEQMKFIEKRLETENGYVREMLKQVLDRLPTVKVDRSIEETYGSQPRRRAKEA
jgi:chromosome segregation ATPase